MVVKAQFKKFMKASTIFFISIALLVISPTPSFSDTNSDILYDGWADLSAQHPDAKNFYGAWWTDASWRGNQGPSGIDNGCASVTSCTTPFRWQAMLPFCDSEQVVNCISDVWAIGSNGKRISYADHRYFPQEQEKVYQGSEKFHVPTGSTGSVVQFPGLLNAAGTSDYAITVLGYGGIESLQADGSYSATDPAFVASINPVKIVQGNYSPMSLKVSNPGFSYWVPSEDANCVVAERGLCAIPVGFPAKTSFGLSLKLNQVFYGWIHGRLSEANFNSKNLGAGVYQLDVIGAPSQVPDVVASVAISNYKPDPANWIGKGPDWNIFAPYRETVAYPAFLAAAPYMTGKASAMPEVWAFRNLKKTDIFSSADQISLKCLVKYSLGGDNPGIVGSLNTNSVTYLPGPPVFNKADQTLEYSVASAHSAPDGSVIHGMYSLQLRSDVARCIFGLDSSPVKATISVISSDGTQTSTTTSLTESQGFLTFRASGFHYSQESIKIHLENSATTATDAVIPKPALIPAPISASKTTIVCLKGKNSKKVTGTRPACPAGYKKIKTLN
jgi:hypothetical protein